MKDTRVYLLHIRDAIVQIESTLKADAKNSSITR